MTRLCVFAAALLFVILSNPLVGHAASFDCTKAASQVEKLICSDNELSKLDDDLSAAYRAASGDPAVADQVRRDQRQWLAARNVCRDRACIKSAYDHRLADLHALRGLTHVGKPAAVSEESQATGVREIQSVEFKNFDSPGVRIDAGRAVFSHYDQSGNSHNIVAVNIADGSARNLAEGVRGGQFVAEDARYLVYSSEGTNANPLVVYDKRANKGVVTTRLRDAILWGHIVGERLLLAQRGMSSDKVTMLVYRLPALKLERSTEITGGNETALWGDKIVSVGDRLGIYDMDLREMAVVDLPKPDPSLEANCGNGPLRISGDKAVVRANCARLAVVDLSTARVERILPMVSFGQSFAVAEGLVFTVDPDGKEPDVRVIDLTSGRELARLGIEASFLAMQGKSLLAMKRKDFSSLGRFTLYEVDFASIRSETSRIARVLNGCRAAAQMLKRRGDLHVTLEACEKAGIRGFVEETNLSPELREAVANYARWLTLSFSRYSEGATILGRIQRTNPSPRIESQMALAKRKAFYLDPPPKEALPSKNPEPKGVTRVPIDFGSFSNLMRFEGDRLYIGRWSCGDGHDTGYAGVTLEVLDRKTFQRIKRVEVAPCNDQQQDSITAISVVPGYVVLGLAYRYEEEGRPTVAVVDAQTLEVVKRGFVKQKIAGLSQWQGRLLACARSSDQLHHRFDPVSARLLAATEDEARACLNGDPVRLTAWEASTPVHDTELVVETPRYRVFADRKWPPTTYHIVQKGGGTTRDIRLPERQYAEALAVPGRDALVLRYASGRRTRFTYFDIETQTDVVLFELNKAGDQIIWGRYLFVALGRDLLMYDLERRIVVGYEKELIREGFLDNCCGKDSNNIDRLVLDEGRLIALTFDGSNTRVIDLTTYTARLLTRDFFLAPEGLEDAPFPEK
jgi:uncharacterized protein